MVRKSKEDREKLKALTGQIQSILVVRRQAKTDLKVLKEERNKIRAKYKKLEAAVKNV